jgi:CBS domain-containing protein
MADRLRVRDLMSKPVRTLGPNEPVAGADELMRMERIRHLPVLDEAGALCGIVSQRDLFRGALARALGDAESAQAKLLGLLRVKDVMNAPVVTASPDETVAEAAARMVEGKLGCLVVVEDGRMLGILTESDFVRSFADR